MKSNIVIKGIAVVIVVILLVVIMKGRKDDSGTQQAGHDLGMSDLTVIESGPVMEDNGLLLAPLEAKLLEEQFGVDVDSPIETMRTLTNETRAVREDSVKLQEENKLLKHKVDQLLKMERNLNNNLTNKFSAAERAAQDKQRDLEHTQGVTKNLINQLEERLEGLQDNNKNKSGKRTASGYNIGSAGIPSGLGYDGEGIPVDFDQIIWSNPIDASIDDNDPSKISLPDLSILNNESIPDLPGREKQKKKKTKEERSTKAYTIPINATLVGSVSMTAMLGRIPIDGQVVDPYPFKIMVGADNLSSNGIKIPGIAGIKMSGIAKGDWTLSCVSGNIMSMTFTFKDGTIVTIPEPGTRATEPLAWFSDYNGIPCITGKRITNAPSYLSQRIGLTAAASYANATAATQFTTQANSDGSFTSGLTGDPTKVATNTAVSESLNEVTDWLDQRQQNSFDAIYIPPGTKLAVHVSEELKIDYDPEGRKVNHYANINRRTDRYLD